MTEYLIGKVPEFKTKRGRKHKPTKEWLRGLKKIKPQSL